MGISKLLKLFFIFIFVNKSACNIFPYSNKIIKQTAVILQIDIKNQKIFDFSSDVRKSLFDIVSQV